MCVGLCISWVLVYRNSHCFVNLFRTILPVVQTECDVLIVCRQHNDKEWKFKEQHAKIWENIAGAIRYSRPVVSTLRGRAPPPFQRLWAKWGHWLTESSTSLVLGQGSWNVQLYPVVKVRGATGGSAPPLLRLWQSLAPLLESEPSLPTAGPKLLNSTKNHNVRCRINKF